MQFSASFSFSPWRAEGRGGAARAPAPAIWLAGCCTRRGDCDGCPATEGGSLAGRRLYEEQSRHGHGAENCFWQHWYGAARASSTSPLALTLTHLAGFLTCGLPALSFWAAGEQVWLPGVGVAAGRARSLGASGLHFAEVSRCLSQPWPAGAKEPWLISAAAREAGGRRARKPLAPNYCEMFAGPKGARLQRGALGRSARR